MVIPIPSTTRKKYLPLTESKWGAFTYKNYVLVPYRHPQNKITWLVICNRYDPDLREEPFSSHLIVLAKTAKDAAQDAYEQSEKLREIEEKDAATSTATRSKPKVYRMEPEGDIREFEETSSDVGV